MGYPPLMPEIGGVLTAMVTPFAEDRSVDEAAARSLARHLVENGSHGLVVAERRARPRLSPTTRSCASSRPCSRRLATRRRSSIYSVELQVSVVATASDLDAPRARFAPAPRYSAA